MIINYASDENPVKTPIFVGDKVRLAEFEEGTTTTSLKLYFNPPVGWEGIVIRDNMPEDFGIILDNWFRGRWWNGNEISFSRFFTIKIHGRKR